MDRIPLPTPFPVGPVNVYLIDDEPLTLVDAGPNGAAALRALERALGRRGRALEDIGLLLLTHQHHDHVGLAGLVKQRSGAEVAAIAPLASRFAVRAGGLESEDDYQAAVLRLHGVPAKTIDELRRIWDKNSKFNGEVLVDRPLADGEAVVLRDRQLTVLHRPGHSPSDTL